jgi:predicted RNA-binding protein with PUA-like domain
MAYYLAKTEPSEYSIDDLQVAGIDEWDGVTNPAAVRHLKQMSDGDYVLIYHSGEKAIVGLAQVVGEGRPDPDQPKSWLRDFKFVTKFPAPVASLADVKATGKFDDWALVRMGRLSVMEVPQHVLSWLRDERGVTLPE